MEISYSELFKTIPTNQQQQFSLVQPEVAANYLYSLQNKKKKKRNNSNDHTNNTTSPSLEEKFGDLAVKKRRKGSEPRKCYNDTCERIVTKRNYCYKCQKRKERGLTLNSKLPSIKHLLLSSEKKARKNKNNNAVNNNEDTATSPNNQLENPLPENTNNAPFIANNSDHPKNHPLFTDLLSIKDSFQRSHNYFDTVLSNLMKDKTPQSNPPCNDQISEPVQNPYISSEVPSNDKQQLQNLHEYLLHLSNGSEEKANSLLLQYISSRSQSPTAATPFDQPPVPHPPSFSSPSFSSVPFTFDPNRYNAVPSNNDRFYSSAPLHPDTFGNPNPYSNNEHMYNDQSMRNTSDRLDYNFLLPQPLPFKSNLFSTPDPVTNTPSFNNQANGASTLNNHNRIRFF